MSLQQTVAPRNILFLILSQLLFLSNLSCAQSHLIQLTHEKIISDSSVLINGVEHAIGATVPNTDMKNDVEGRKKKYPVSSQSSKETAIIAEKTIKTTTDEHYAKVTNSHRQLEGDASLSKVVEALLDTPPDQWDAEQIMTFLILIIVSLVLFCCLCCICCIPMCCGGGAASRPFSFCQDLLLMFCCYELFCGGTNDCCGEAIPGGDYMNGLDGEIV